MCRVPAPHVIGRRSRRAQLLPTREASGTPLPCHPAGERVIRRVDESEKKTDESAGFAESAGVVGEARNVWGRGENGGSLRGAVRADDVRNGPEFEGTQSDRELCVSKICFLKMIVGFVNHHANAFVRFPLKTNPPK